jgi:hypothetical protein
VSELIITLAAAADVLLKAPIDTEESRKERRRWMVAVDASKCCDVWCSDDAVVAERSFAAREAAKKSLL